MSDNETKERTVLVAPPGWFIAWFLEGGEFEGRECDPALSLEPIIAWEIERTESDRRGLLKRSFDGKLVQHFVTPITIDGNVNESSNLWAVKSPDGRFDIPVHGIYENEAEALRAMIDLRRQLDPKTAKEA